ncbi:MAG: hypothetical protein HY053_09405 [Proteobacteria bacterium]|nr:hypothetical protein [Pseudomonadota bacterium]
MANNFNIVDWYGADNASITHDRSIKHTDAEWRVWLRWIRELADRDNLKAAFHNAKGVVYPILQPMLARVLPRSKDLWLNGPITHPEPA